MKILFMGTPDFSVTILRALCTGGYRPDAVVTSPDKMRGRHGTPVPSETARAAEELGIPVLKTQRVRENAEEILSMKPDLIVTASFGQIVPDSILYGPRFGCLNVHASLLPAYRGASPIQRAILDGNPVTGITIMRMDSGLDTGDILAQTEVPVGSDDTAGSLSEKLADAGAKLLLSMLPAYLAGEIAGTPQPAESTTPYAGMIRKEEGRILWEDDAASIARRVRAMIPWPVTYTCLDGKTLRIFSAIPAEAEDAAAEPGTILSAGKEGILVSCGRGTLLVTEVQMEGKRRMGAGEFLRGYRIRDMKFL